MAASDQSALVRLPARLCINPTDLSTAFPHGGTSLGLVRDIVLMVKKFTVPVSEEGFGGRVVIDALEVGEQWGVTGVLRAPDQGVLQNFVAASAVGSVTGETGIVSPPNTGSIGTWLGDRAVKLCISPLDPMQWFGYFPRAIASLAEENEIANSIDRDYGIAFAFRATPPATGKTAYYMPKEDITLQ